MQNLEQLIQHYLKDSKMMQIATLSGDQPWSSTVYFVADQEFNLYWISKPESRHSQEIQNHPKVAASIPIKFDDLNVIGLQLEGDACLIEKQELIDTKVKLYSDKFNRSEDWYQNFLDGKSPFKLYTIKPKLFVLYDRVNFPDAERQEWKLN